MQQCDKTQDLPGLPPGGPAPEPAQPAGATRTALPAMTHTQRLARAADKRSSLLRFLASSEVWTTSEIAAVVMGVSRRRALDALAAMERDALIACEAIPFAGRQLKLFGITPHGCAVADAFDSPHFERGRTNPSWVEHKLCGQRLRLAAEAAGWRWQPERALRLRAAAEGWKKIPDAVATSPADEVVAIEVERHCKTPKRYAELWLAYLQDMKAGRFRRVDFVCPPNVEVLVARAMARVTHVKLNGEAVAITETHRARFGYFSFQNWPGENHGR